MEEESIIGEEVDLEYNDLDVVVEGEFGGEPIPDGKPMWAPITYSDEYTATGHITYWVYSHEITLEDVKGYIKDVLKEQPTTKLINEVTVEDIYDYLLDKYQAAAERDARENFDYDEVEWEDPDDYNPYDDYEPDYDN